jgi:hypothetical protein
MFCYTWCLIYFTGNFLLHIMQWHITYSKTYNIVYKLVFININLDKSYMLCYNAYIYTYVYIYTHIYATNIALYTLFLLNLAGLDLQIFNFTVVWKWYTFSWNHTLDFGFWILIFSLTSNMWYIPGDGLQRQAAVSSQPQDCKGKTDTLL